jgi:hypothetical protein
MKKQTIRFRPSKKFAENLQTQPVIAVSKIPEWYKKMPKFLNDKVKIPTVNENSNLTLKMCPPFLDAMISGYIITLPFDIWVNEENSSQPRFLWEAGGPDYVEMHSIDQYPGLKIPKEFSENAYKFNTTHIIETPLEYSLLITHPFNIIDLPFLSFSGVVDSDKYNILPINIPFLIKKDFVGIIEKGTPIAQILPIKRERWSHVVEKYDQNKSEFAILDLKSTIIRSYKNRWWNKKIYE